MIGLSRRTGHILDRLNGSNMIGLFKIGVL